MESSIFVMIKNVDLCKKMNTNLSIDYVKIYPNTILFGVVLQYCGSKGDVVRIESDSGNTIEVGSLEDVSKIFKCLEKRPGSSKEPYVLYVWFDESHMSVATMTQVVENISCFLRR